MQHSVIPEGPEVEVRWMRLALERRDPAPDAASVETAVLLLPLRKPPLHFYRYLLDRVGREWHWIKYLCLGDDELAGRVHAVNRDIRLLLVDGAPAGFFDLEIGDNGETELVYFGLMPHAQGRGLGKWMLSQAIDIAFVGGARRLVLSTCSLDHPAALGVYLGAGFELFEERLSSMRLLTEAQRAAILSS